MANAVTHPGQDSDFALAGLLERARLWLLTVACFGVLLVIASMVALNTALPDMATAMSATQTQLTWIVDSYTLVLACLLLPAGALGDRYGRRGALRRLPPGRDASAGGDVTSRNGIGKGIGPSRRR